MKPIDRVKIKQFMCRQQIDYTRTYDSIEVLSLYYGIPDEDSKLVEMMDSKLESMNEGDLIAMPGTESHIHLEVVEGKWKIHDNVLGDKE